MRAMQAPTSVTPLAWIVTVGGVMVAGVMLADIYVGGYQQPLQVTEAGWPIAELSTGAPAGGPAAAKGVPGHRNAHSLRFVVPQDCRWQKGRRPRKC
jgi:hypothetical protein